MYKVTILVIGLLLSACASQHEMKGCITYHDGIMQCGFRGLK